MIPDPFINDRGRWGECCPADRPRSAARELFPLIVGACYGVAVAKVAMAKARARSQALSAGYDRTATVNRRLDRLEELVTHVSSQPHMRTYLESAHRQAEEPLDHRAAFFERRRTLGL